MTMSEADDVAAFAQARDSSQETEQGVWEVDTAAGPVITTCLRLPASLLDRVREQAAVQHVRPSGPIRQRIEQRRDAGEETGVEDLTERLERLERAVFARSDAL